MLLLTYSLHVGVNIPIPENHHQPQTIENQQHELERKSTQQRQDHNITDVWTFPEGSAIMSQNIVPLSTLGATSQASQAHLPNQNAVTLPPATVTPGNKSMYP